MCPVSNPWYKHAHLTPWYCIYYRIPTRYRWAVPCTTYQQPMSTFAFNHRLEKVYMCAVKDDYLLPQNTQTTKAQLHRVCIVGHTSSLVCSKRLRTERCVEFAYPCGVIRGENSINSDYVNHTVCTWFRTIRPGWKYVRCSDKRRGHSYDT